MPIPIDAANNLRNESIEHLLAALTKSIGSENGRNRGRRHRQKLAAWAPFCRFVRGECRAHTWASDAPAWLFGAEPVDGPGAHNIDSLIVAHRVLVVAAMAVLSEDARER